MIYWPRWSGGTNTSWRGSVEWLVYWISICRLPALQCLKMGTFTFSLFMMLNLIVNAMCNIWKKLPLYFQSDGTKYVPMAAMADKVHAFVIHAFRWVTLYINTLDIGICVWTQLASYKTINEDWRSGGIPSCWETKPPIYPDPNSSSPLRSISVDATW